MKIANAWSRHVVYLKKKSIVTMRAAFLILNEVLISFITFANLILYCGKLMLLCKDHLEKVNAIEA